MRQHGKADERLRQIQHKALRELLDKLDEVCELEPSDCGEAEADIWGVARDLRDDLASFFEEG